MRFSGLSIRQLEAFDMVMKVGTVSAAANAMYVSQPSVSRLLQDLEKDTGLKLFERTQGRLVPTVQAIMFHEEVAGSFKSVQTLMRAAQDIRELRGSKFRVGALAAASLELIPSVLRSFKTSYPDADVNVAVRSSADIVSSVAAQHIDIGIVDGGISLLDTISVGEFRWDSVCVMDEKHPLAERTQIDMKDFVRFPFVSLGSEYMARSPNGARLASLVGNLIEVETFQSFLACGFVRNSLSLAVVDPLTASFYERAGLVSRKLVDPIPFSFALIVNHRSKNSSAVEHFSAVLKSHVVGLHPAAAGSGSGSADNI